MASLTRQRLAGFFKAASVAAMCSSTGLYLLTRQCFFEPFSADADPIFRHPWIRKINPKNYPGFQDCFVRTVSLEMVNSELLEDALAGGPKLIERFSAGVWGRYAFRIQLATVKATRKDHSNTADLWGKDELLQSKYSEGTILADDFIVIDKTANSIMFRGGMSPRANPDGPREFDTVVGLSVDLDPQARVATFKLKTILVDGISGQANLGTVATFLHQQYAKLLLTAGVDHCLG